MTAYFDSLLLLATLLDIALVHLIKLAVKLGLHVLLVRVCNHVQEQVTNDILLIVCDLLTIVAILSLSL